VVEWTRAQVAVVALLLQHPSKLPQGQEGDVKFCEVTRGVGDT